MGASLPLRFTGRASPTPRNPGGYGEDRAAGLVEDGFRRIAHAAMEQHAFSHVGAKDDAKGKKR